jgi:hypothetical protein
VLVRKEVPADAVSRCLFRGKRVSTTKAIPAVSDVSALGVVDFSAEWVSITCQLTERRLQMYIGGGVLLLILIILLIIFLL